MRAKIEDSMGFPRQAPEELQRRSKPPRIGANGVAWLPVPGWSDPWLWAGFSTRRQGLSRAWSIPSGEDLAPGQEAPGELNLGLNPQEDAETTLANRRLFAEAVTGDPKTPLVSLRQIHSKHVLMALADGGVGGRPAKGDGLLTKQPGLLLAVQTADCIPVLVADRRNRAVAAFHAGWRGTVKRIVEAGIGRMRLEFGSRPEDLGGRDRARHRPVLLRGGRRGTL